jgi:hypothetical protein
MITETNNNDTTYRVRVQGDLKGNFLKIPRSSDHVRVFLETLTKLAALTEDGKESSMNIINDFLGDFQLLTQYYDEFSRDQIQAKTVFSEIFTQLKAQYKKQKGHKKIRIKIMIDIN